MSTFIRIFKRTKIHYHVKLQRNLTGKFLSYNQFSYLKYTKISQKGKIVIKCHQNLIVSSVYHNAYPYQVCYINFQFVVYQFRMDNRQTDRHTHTTIKHTCFVFISDQRLITNNNNNNNNNPICKAPECQKTSVALLMKPWKLKWQQKFICTCATYYKKVCIPQLLIVQQCTGDTVLQQEAHGLCSLAGSTAI